MELTDDGNRAIQSLALRYGVSMDAVKTLLLAVNAGGGSMAQFYHSELGGGGQWMRGGMTMVGDMFNHGLQATVANLCSELSALLATTQVLTPARNANGSFGGFNKAWWPSELGSPSSSGSQNDARYAYFPQAQRLAIDRNGQQTIYDTLDHQIGGVQQQQGGAYGSLSFSSQFGTFTVDSLPRVDANRNVDWEPQYSAPDYLAPEAPYQPQETYQPQDNQAQGNYRAQSDYQTQQSWQPLDNQPQPSPANSQPSNNPSPHDILATLERLSELHQKGILSEDEFRSKKTDLLNRL